MNSDASATATRLRINIPPNGITDQPLHEPFRPPLDPPPFEPVHVRRCVRTNVRIQNHDSLEEVLILTSLTSSVDTFLNESTAHDEDVDDELDDYEDGSDLSESFSSTSSSSSSSYDDMEEEKIDGERSNREVSRMKAYWPTRDPICEVCHSVRGFLLNFIDLHNSQPVFAFENYSRITMALLSRTYTTPGYYKRQT